MKVDVFPLSGPKATGSVTVEVAGTTVAGELSGGAVTVRAGVLPRGIHSIAVAYGGSATVSPTKGFGLVVVR